MLLKPILYFFSLSIWSGSDAFVHDQQIIVENTPNLKNEPHLAPMGTPQDHSAPVAQHDASLKVQPRHAIMYNRYAPLEDFHRAVGPPESLERLHFPSAADDIQADNLACFIRKHDCKQKDAILPPPRKASNGLLTHWNSDLASVLAIHILQVLSGDSVLDLRAATGNKSLIAAQSLWPYLQPSSSGPPLPGAKKGLLHSNEFDPDDNRRLASNLAEYLPASLSVSGQQQVLHIDSIRGAKDLPVVPGGYDKVLVDASSFSEHQDVQTQMVDPAYRTPKHVTGAQAQLLLTALNAVRYGGRVLYSTSTVSRGENDAVVEEAMRQVESKKTMGDIVWSVEVETLDAAVQKGLEADWADRTEKGWNVLPNHAGSGKSGPLYFSLLTKKAA
ncbi:hypothetical protein Q7P37_006890 [Cladosporium fusiforme]